jgi:hypothetical protein
MIRNEPKRLAHGAEGEQAFVHVGAMGGGSTLSNLLVVGVFGAAGAAIGALIAHVPVAQAAIGTTKFIAGGAIAGAMLGVLAAG